MEFLKQFAVILAFISCFVNGREKVTLNVSRIGLFDLPGKIVEKLIPGRPRTSPACSALNDFPKNVELQIGPYKNWAQAIEVSNIWTATPKCADDVVLLAVWASKNGFKLRARGYMHNWSPIVITPDQLSCGKVILVDTTKHLTSMRMVSTAPLPSVQVETGATLESLLTFLETVGFGITNHPAPGDITVGGMLAINGHGAGVQIPGTSGIYGSISNLVLSLDAIVWNEEKKSYEIKTFDRGDPETKALLTNLGRLFITQVTLRVVPGFNMRCISRTDIPASELFADPSKARLSTRTFSKLMEDNGAIETILFPFTSRPWIKIWSVAPVKPLLSTAVSNPYNYPFSDNIPVPVSDLAERIVAGEWHLAPVFGDVGYQTAAVNLLLLSDLWGPSKNVLLYVKPTTLRVTANGYAVLTNRTNVQLVISKFYAFYENLLTVYADQDLYPINGPLEIRVTGLDNPEDVGIPKAEAPTLSAIKPIEGRPDLNAAVWFDCLTFPTTPNLTNFMTAVEEFVLNEYDPAVAIARPEWSKGWAYTNSSGWSNKEMLSATIPELYSGDTNGNNWNFAVNVFDKYDSKHIFTNSFLDELLV